MYEIINKNNYTIIKNIKNHAEIQLTNIGELKKILNELINSGKKNILIDFENVFYIDSAGLGTLLDAMKKLKEKNQELGILSISKDLLEVFTATKIAQYFKFYKSI